MVGGSVVSIHHYNWSETFPGKIFILMLCVAPLSICSFGFIFLFFASFSTVLSVCEFLDSIILVVQNLIMLYRNSDEWRLGRGGGRG